MLKYNKGISLSKAVLDYLEMMGEYYIETFRNEDKNGFIVLNEKGDRDKVAYITNGENNFRINIYIGQFSETGISPKAYANVKSFDMQDAYQAAIYITNNIV
jgi:rRNA pseudouridine-1189 N-methylase Emg1 (Nep1/Mra1 family)